jgi:hypothetical protein
VFDVFNKSRMEIAVLRVYNALAAASTPDGKVFLQACK